MKKIFTLLLIFIAYSGFAQTFDIHVMSIVNPTGSVIDPNWNDSVKFQAHNLGDTIPASDTVFFEQHWYVNGSLAGGAATYFSGNVWPAGVMGLLTTAPTDISTLGANPGDEIKFCVIATNAADMNSANDTSCSTFTAEPASINESDLQYISVLQKSRWVEVSINNPSKIASTEVMLFNSNGRLIQNINMNETKLTLDLNNYSSGLYIVRVQSANHNFSKKIVLN